MRQKSLHGYYIVKNSEEDRNCRDEILFQKVPAADALKFFGRGL